MCAAEAQGFVNRFKTTFNTAIFVLSVMLSQAGAMAQQLTLKLQVSDAATPPAYLLHRAPGPVTDTSTGLALPVGGYRWLIQRDVSAHVNPSMSQTNPNTIALQFHKSHMPHVAQGDDKVALPSWVTGCDAQASPHAVCLDPTSNYFISILPNTPPLSAQTGCASAAGTGVGSPAWCGWYLMGGSPITSLQSSVSVRLVKQPMNTGRLSVHVYQDNSPINGEADLPDELGLPGFTVTLDDGISLALGGFVQDSWGNLLGTQYKQCPATGTIFGVACTPGTFNVNGVYVYDPNTGAPQTATDPSTGGVYVKPLVSGDCGYSAANHPELVPPPGTPVNKLDACGELIIENLRPGKFGVQAIPIAGSGWVQTSTIEGTRPQEAFVPSNGPPYFQEFGPPGYHAEIGFVKPFNSLKTGVAGSQTVTGRVVNTHLSAPPEEAFFNSAPIPSTTPWIGLNSATGTTAGPGLYVAQGNADGTFTIPNVPPGTYAMFVFDVNLDFINATTSLTVGATGCNGTTSCILGDLPVQDWFHQNHHLVYYDSAGTGKFTPGSTYVPIPAQTVNLRYRDGSMYQSAISDPNGYVPFDEVFPFFAWLVEEFDPGRLKPTGLTAVIDQGGPVNPTDQYSLGGGTNPQKQPDGNSYRVQTATADHDVFTQAFQGFNSLQNTTMWGVAPYGPTENGGIRGMVYFDTERAEWDPRFSVSPGTEEVYEVGVPNVTVNLYQAVLNAQGLPVYCSTPGSATTCALPGNILQLGPRVATTSTSSFDASAPTGCSVLEKQPYTFAGKYVPDCFDGMRDWNQIRPGAFDGAYQFKQCIPDPASTTKPPACLSIGKQTPAQFATAAGKQPLPAGSYFVEIVPPADSNGSPVYEVGKEENKNADFGELFTPQSQPAACIGNLHTVPQYMLAFPPNATAQVPGAFLGIQSIYAGLNRPLCDRKIVQLSNGGSVSQLSFTLLNEVPPAAHAYGFILDDMSNEFNKPSPNFGEKYAPPNMPVSVRDYTGTEISRAYTDQFGVYDFLVPAGYGANPPTPASYYPVIYQLCMNSRLKADGTQDPHWNPSYGESCFFWDFWPGKTSYLDTPVVPVAAFSGPNQFPVDCNLPSGTPRINQVTSSGNGIGGGPYLDPSKSLTIEIDAVVTPAGIAPPNSVGTDWVTNPNFCPGPGVLLDPTACNDANGTPTYDNNKLIQRDYGFGGTKGKVQLLLTAGSGSDEATSCTLGAANITKWTNSQILANLGADAGCSNPGAYQLVVTRGDNGNTTLTNVTLTVGPLGTYTTAATTPATPRVTYQRTLRTVGNANNIGAGTLGGPNGPNYATIQAAIDDSNPGDLVLVAPGVYREILLMWKPLQIQGWGEGSTNVDAVKSPPNKLLIYRTEQEGLWTTNTNPATGIVSLNGSNTPVTNTTINNIKSSTGVRGCPTAPCIDLLPNQAIETGPAEVSSVIEPSTLYDESGGDFLVLAKSDGPMQFVNGSDSNGIPVNARLDGLSMSGADAGGGVVVNAWAHYLTISNNRIHNNYGFWNGGVRLGIPDLLAIAAGSLTETYVKAPNDHVLITHNQIAMNGTTSEGGSSATAAGGVLLCTGADNYRVTQNFVCGNFADADGGAIGHFGVNNNGRIDHNQIQFNESFFQGATTSAGGISLIGTVPPGATVSDGVGNVTIDSNVIKGNLAGAGDGGGIAINRANGADLFSAVTAACPTATSCLKDPKAWWTVGIYNNLIVDNLSGLAGGGISMVDSVDIQMVNNTIANNASLATAGVAFPGNNPNKSIAQPAGIVSRGHVTLAPFKNLAAPAVTNPLGYVLGSYSNPVLFNNIIWGNRSFYFGGNVNITPVTYSENPCIPSALTPCLAGGIWDTGVLGDTGSTGNPAATTLNPNYSVLSPGYTIASNSHNVTGPTPVCNPSSSLLFQKEYCDGARQPNVTKSEAPNNVLPTVAFDEGGNAIRVRFGPIAATIDSYNGSLLSSSTPTFRSDYHLNPTAAAIRAGTFNIQCTGGTSCGAGTVVYPAFNLTIGGILGTDIDGQSRTAATLGINKPDVGADQHTVVVPRPPL